MKSYVIIFYFIAISFINAQDVQILNIDSELHLSSLLAEVSGMCYYKNNIYAINDGGNGSYIFKLDLLTGEIKQKYRLENIRNRDWEELSVYDGYLYIGDFGNNRGNRTDLSIHRVNIKDLGKSKPPFLTTWMDYLARNKKGAYPRDHAWDCEAMTVTSNGIFCFSKDRKDYNTQMYKLIEGEKNILNPIQSFNTGFLVTGAYYHSIDRSLYLCGYRKGETYLLHFRTADTIRFSGHYNKYIIPELKNTQVESVFVLGDYIYLASERTRKRPAIYKIKVSSLN